MKKRKLLWQLYPSYLIVILVSLLAVNWYTSNYLRDFFLHRTETDLKTQSLLIKQQITKSLKSSDISSVDRQCKVLGKDAPTRITVIMPDGTVIGDSEEDPLKMDNHRDRPEIITAFSGKEGASIRYSNTLQKKMMYKAIPVVIDNQLIAVLRTSIPVTYIDNEIHKIQLRIIWTGLVIALLASVVCFFISRRISAPIEELEYSAEKYAAGELGHRLSPSPIAEFSTLANAMNKMAAELEDRLRRIETQRNEYEAVLSSMREGVIAVDTDEHLLSINQAAIDMLNTNLKEFKGLSIQAVVRNTELQNQLVETMASGNPKENDIIVHKEGEKIINTKSSPLYDSEGNRIGALLVLNDVTQLRQLDKMRSDFAANVSHELKTPLTAIKGFVETLMEGAVENIEDAKRFLEIISKHVNRLNYIIDDLLHLSRIEQLGEKNDITVSDISIKDAIQTSISICAKKASEKNIGINQDCSEDIRISGDSSLLEQAFINLLDNAIKYSDDGTHVLVHCFTEAEDVVIRFKDQGSGIASEHLPRLFERFYRVDKARSRKLGGTGLGLAIVKHIVQAHNGHINVESTLGEGSTFEVHLPV